MQEFVINAMMNPAGQVELTFYGGPMGFSGTGQTPFIPNVTTMARFQMAKFFISYTSAANMQLGLFVKSGAVAGVSEVVSCDYASGLTLSQSA